MRRVIEPPARLANPIVNSADDKCFQPYVSVLRDPDTRRFRLWYNTAVSSSQSHIGYMESEDGIHFLRPARELDDPSGLKVGFGASVLDDGAAFADPDRRFKLAYHENGLCVSFSRDGLKWTAASDRPVLTGIGYAEALAHIRGEISLEKLPLAMAQSNRQYARRQLRWWRRDPRVRWFQIEPDPMPAILKYLKESN